MANLISSDLTKIKLWILRYTTSDGEMLSVKDGAFDGRIVSHTYNDVGEIVFSKPITTIGTCAFESCRNLTSMSLPDGVITIKNWAFQRCTGLKSISIPDSVTSIGDGAFSACI